VNTIRTAIRLLVFGVLCVLAAAACVDPRRPPPTTTTTRPTADTLVEWTNNGGFCGAPCAQRITISRTGAWTLVDGPRPFQGQLSALKTNQLRTGVQVGVASLATLPRSGGCPSIRDGNDLTYRFHGPGGVTEVSNCTHVIPSGNALLLLTDGIVALIISTARSDGPDELLVEYDFGASLCPAPACSEAITITRAGAWHAEVRGRYVDGHLDPGQAESFAAAVATGVDTLAAIAKPDTCHPFIDNARTAISYHVGDRATRVGNCTHDFRDNELILTTFRIVNQIRERVMAEPEPLVEWSAIGGLCPWGDCSQSVTIDWHGTWRATNGSNRREGSLDPVTVAQLRDHILAGLDSLATLEPTDGLCPSNHDGSDITYALYVDGRGREVSNCRHVLPEDNQLLRFVQGVVTPIIATVPNPPPIPP
jgi:hypothetical protein